MKRHSWIVGVLGDLIDYAEKNHLTETQSALIGATEVIAPELCSLSPEDEDLLMACSASPKIDSDVVVRLDRRKVPKG